MRLSVSGVIETSVLPEDPKASCREALVIDFATLPGEGLQYSANISRNRERNWDTVILIEAPAYLGAQLAARDIGNKIQETISSEKISDPGLKLHEAVNVEENTYTPLHAQRRIFLSKLNDQELQDAMHRAFHQMEMNPYEFEEANKAVRDYIKGVLAAEKEYDSDGLLTRLREKWAAFRGKEVRKIPAFESDTCAGRNGYFGYRSHLEHYSL